MYAAPVILLAFAIAASNLPGATLSIAPQTRSANGWQAKAAPDKSKAPSAAEEFERLRIEGNEAIYNLDYKEAKDIYLRMTKLAPDHPAGYVYLANNLWLETLNASRRLTASLYSSGSFYAQDADEDKSDPKRDREFEDLLKQGLAAAEARLRKNPKDVEALYYQGAARGLKAGYSVTVKRSFRKAIGDANASIKIQKKVVRLDPEYIDAYLSIGLYEYVIDSLPWIWKVLARLAGLKGSKEKGFQYLEMVAERGKYTADDARVLLIGLYSREGQPERALEQIAYLVNKYPRNYVLGVERAAMLFRMDRREEGTRAFEGLLKDERVAREAIDMVNYQWAEALIAAGKYAEAVEKYNAVKQWPKSSEELVSLSHLHAGQALDALGKRDEAVAEYQIVLKRENVFDSHKLAGEYVRKPYVPAKV